MKRTKIKCQNCNREISRSNYSRHSCNIKKSIYKINDNLYECECKRQFINNAHFCYCLIHRKGKLFSVKNKIPFDGKQGWAKGLTKETDERVAKFVKTNHDNYVNRKTIPSFKDKHHTKETKERLSISNSGKNSGHVKTKYYEVFCP